MAFGKKLKEIMTDEETNEDSYYTKDAMSLPNASGKMILLEPRAFSESQQIADHLKGRNTVVVNMKRVTAEQAKRIIDFLSGTVYAIGGDLQKIGVGIFLCTPKNINVEGAISEDDGKKQEDIELDNGECMKRFSIVENGYDIDEVNRFIDIVIGRLEKLNAENAAYVVKIDKLNMKLQEEKPNEEKLEKAILAVQETADRMKEVSKEEARIIIEEAKNNANSIVHEALIRAEKIEQESLMLEKNIKIYKERVKSLLEAQLKIAEDLDKIEL